MLIRSNGFSQVIPLPTTRDILPLISRMTACPSCTISMPGPPKRARAAAWVALQLNLTVADDPGASTDAEQDVDRGLATASPSCPLYCSYWLYIC